MTVNYYHSKGIIIYVKEGGGRVTGDERERETWRWRELTYDQLARVHMSTAKALASDRINKAQQRSQYRVA